MDAFKEEKLENSVKSSKSLRSKLGHKNHEARCRSETWATAVSVAVAIMLFVFLLTDITKVLEPGPAGFVTWLFLVGEAILAPFMVFAVWASLKLIRLRCPGCLNRKQCRLLVRKSD